ncbi:GNAT family N-acetyltransferase [Halorussus sp. MSC15.2]|uniref:GNAT family N-acetyltransferase n=1 Tax=Halorussus sp. MSC15.2 TaxID=2283638 RepID=UPI0013D06FFF|nr:GNAT family N-acetyltransferase [Halorussus sp. MSC15.2]NEU55738.1 GNAT family N-acetyltransferase [Halorussus sp. MSC15.2]
MATPQLEFESDVATRIYRCVERRGSAAREEVRDEVRVEETAGAKPPRSGTESATRLSVAEFNDHLDELLEAGALTERDGRLYVSPDADAETHETDEFEYAIRPADEDDREAVAELIRDVAAEGAIVVDERVADAIERDGALVRLNERESRMFFVAELRREDTEEGENAGNDDSKGEDGEREHAGNGVAEDEIIGWVHLQGFELPARSHTAELTVGVAPEYREAGVGGTLLERGMSWADDGDYLKVYQSLPATNEDALELLDEYGWEREATRADHYRVEGDLVDEVQMAKRLDRDE